MDLIKQFPDISMEVREKFRLRKKLNPNYMSNSMPRYETNKYLINATTRGHGVKWLGTKLFIIVLLCSILIYLAILNASDIL
jgi:hypothetical protein